MIFPPIRAAVLAAAATAALAGCSSHGGYGYGSSPYPSSYYGGSAYFGWYDGYYYPGTGYYVYDRRGYRHSWNAKQRRHWEARGEYRRGGRENWSGYNRDRRRDHDRRDRRRR